MYKEKHHSWLARIISRCGKTLSSELFDPIKKSIADSRDETAFNDYRLGLTEIEKTGLYEMFVPGTIIKMEKGSPEAPKYSVTIQSILGEHNYENQHLSGRYKKGQKMLLTVFVTTRDTWNYFPENKPSDFSKKMVICSVPLEYRVVGMMDR
jgi:hypothetical protein